MKFPYANVALNYGSTLFETSFFLIDLDLEIDHENILLKNMKKQKQPPEVFYEKTCS